MTKKKQPPSLPASPTIAQLRDAIAQAQGEGIRAKDMVLHLTLRDESRIKRSRDVAMDEVSFNDGEMRFLGIRVITGDVTVSALDRAEP
ncbi:MAG: hypothetical protein V4466_18170 [Pseudomonadota bacterium]